jgi:hypothetical protein
MEVGEKRVLFNLSTQPENASRGKVSISEALKTRLKAIPFSDGDINGFHADERTIIQSSPVGMLEEVVTMLKKEPQINWEKYKSEIEEIAKTKKSKIVKYEEYNLVRQRFLAEINDEIKFKICVGHEKWKKSTVDVIFKRVRNYIDSKFMGMVNAPIR